MNFFNKFFFYLLQGVGASTQADPYENFRRNKANSFIHRIRSRDERS